MRESKVTFMCMLKTNQSAGSICFLLWFRKNKSFLNKLLVLFKVYITLHGDDWVSDPIELKSPTGKPLLERSSCDVFVHRTEWKYPCRGVGGQTDLER